MTDEDGIHWDDSANIRRDLNSWGWVFMMVLRWTKQYTFFGSKRVCFFPESTKKFNIGWFFRSKWRFIWSVQRNFTLQQINCLAINDKWNCDLDKAALIERDWLWIKWKWMKKCSQIKCSEKDFPSSPMGVEPMTFQNTGWNALTTEL